MFRLLHFFLKFLIKLFPKKFAGSQDCVLSRRPHTAEHPCGQGSLRQSLSRSPQRAELFSRFFEKKLGKKLSTKKIKIKLAERPFSNFIPQSTLQDFAFVIY